MEEVSDGTVREGLGDEIMLEKGIESHNCSGREIYTKRASETKDRMIVVPEDESGL